MLCPKCKTHISDNVLRCPKCNLKVKIVCPNCSSVNYMGQKICKSCGYEIFVKCSSCNAVNLSGSKFCRKCGENLLQNEPVIDISENIPDENITEVKINDIVQETKENDSIPSIDEESTTEINVNLNEEKFADNIIEEENNNYNELVEEFQIGTIDESQKTESLKKEDDFLVSTDNIDITDEQLTELFEKVEEIEKNKERKKEAESLIQRKFEQNEEVDNENEEEIPPEYVLLNQQDAQTAIIESIQNPLKRIISLNGKEGFGKTLILKYSREALRSEDYIWAWGECNALTQITPFGYLQDVLLNLFNLSNFCINVEDFIMQNTKALEAQFFNLNSKEINDLLNFLYPSKTSDFNGILKRKEYTFSIIKKVFENMAIKSMIIFVVDDFENIDGASFDFLKNLLEDERLREKVKIIITNKYNKIAQGYFYNKDLNNNNYSNIFLSGLDDNQCMNLVTVLYGSDINLPNYIKEQLCKNAKGSSAYIEQVCLLLNEEGVIKQDESGNIIFNAEFENFNLPKNVYRVLEQRIGLLEKRNYMLVTALYYAGLLGNKFSIHQFENILQFLKITKDEFNNICNFLINANYLTPMSENYLMFSNTLVWHYVYERAKTEENYVELNNNIYMCVQYLTLSNNSLKPILLQNSNNKKEAYAEWNRNVGLSGYLGDTNLYVISLKQLVKLADEVSGLMSAQERIVIMERMGKILYKLSPKEAISYLSASISYYKEQTNYNPVKIVELSGFLVKSCETLGDYLGIIESCDEACNALSTEQYSLEKAIIISKKLKALISLGNCEEVVTLSKTELLDVMENSLAKSGTSSIISDEIIFEAWLDTNLSLSYAYAIQGNINVFDVIAKLEEAISINKIEESTYLQKVMIVKALAYTMRGEIKLSADILTGLKSKFFSESSEEELILRWNFINIMNKIISVDYQNITDEMFHVATFADNINDNLIKNMLKLLLGYVIQAKTKRSEKALDIFNEEIVYFSKEKIATGALLCWFLIANASINSKGIDFALDIALKALDVAKGPKVDNFIFIIAFKQLIASLYLKKQDFEAVKMYLEKAMVIAQQNNLKFMQMLLYQSFAKYFEELLHINKEEEMFFVNKVSEMYKKAVNLSKQLMLNEQEAAIIKDYTAFKVSCHLKNIVVTEEDEAL